MIDRSTRDALSDVLDNLHLKAEVYKHGDYCGIWQLNTSGSGRASFHVVGRGSGWLHLKDRDPIPLCTGDLVLFPRDAWHVVAGERDMDDESTTSTTVLCGFFDFGVREGNAILDSLPDVLLVRAEDVAANGALETLIRTILAEAASDGCGRQALLDRLCEALFVLVLRHHLETTEERHGLLAALAEPRLREPLGAMQQDPGHHWTVDGMAKLAGMSRTAFATTFRSIVGEAPMRYLTSLRMREASRMLTDRTMPVSAIAQKLGYDTEAAFRRAFKRTVGVTPGSVRRAG